MATTKAKGLAEQVQEFLIGLVKSGWGTFALILGVILFLGILGLGAEIVLEVIGKGLTFLTTAATTVKGWF